MNRDLFIAILSMDSYNRGYGQSIREDKLGGNRVGDATILTFSSEVSAGWEAAGFYAIAYKWDGETIISFRGSDSINKKAALANFLGKAAVFGLGSPHHAGRPGLRRRHICDQRCLARGRPEDLRSPLSSRSGGKHASSNGGRSEKLSLDPRCLGFGYA